MNFEESLSVTAQIGKAIARGAPQITCSPEELAEARSAYSENKLAELEKLGFYHGDFELFYYVTQSIFAIKNQTLFFHSSLCQVSIRTQIYFFFVYHPFTFTHTRQREKKTKQTARIQILPTKNPRYKQSKKYTS